MGIDFTEFKKYAKNFKNMRKEFNQFLKEFLIENAELVITLAKNRTPVDTGALRATWGLGLAKYQEAAAKGGLKQEEWSGEEIEYQNLGLEIVDVSGNNMTVVIWNGMEYALICGACKTGQIR